MELDDSLAAHNTPGTVGYALNLIANAGLLDAAYGPHTTPGTVGQLLGFLGATVSDINGNTDGLQGNVIDTLVNTVAIKAKTDTLPASPAAVGDIPTASQNASAVMGSVVDGAGTTLTQALRAFIAVLLGKTSRASGVRKFRNRLDTKDVVSATTNNNGDRTAVTLDLS